MNTLNAFTYKVSKDVKHGSSWPTFNSTVEIKLESRSIILVFQTSITGCGIGSIYGVSQFYGLKDEEIKYIRKVIQDAGDRFIPEFSVGNNINNRQKISCFIVTLGQYYINKCEETLLKIGFTKIDDFHNAQHGANYRQSVYSIKLHE